MPPKKNNSEISVGYWMFALFVTFFPLLNLIAVPILAFGGSNPTKKNYYRAILGWFVVLLLIQIVILIFGFGPALYEAIKTSISK